MKRITLEDCTTARHHPERSRFTASIAIAHGGTAFGRRLTLLERLTIATMYAEPNGTLTLHTPQMTRAEIAPAWKRLVKRIERHKSAPGRLVYVGVPAKARCGGGYHLHVLVWEYVAFELLAAHVRPVGFGKPRIAAVPSVWPLLPRRHRIRTAGTRVSELMSLGAQRCGRYRIS